MIYLIFALIVLVIMFGYYEIFEDKRYQDFPEYYTLTFIRLIPHMIAVSSLILNIMCMDLLGL